MCELHLSSWNYPICFGSNEKIEKYIFSIIKTTKTKQEPYQQFLGCKRAKLQDQVEKNTSVKRSHQKSLKRKLTGTIPSREMRLYYEKLSDRKTCQKPPIMVCIAKTLYMHEYLEFYTKFQMLYNDWSKLILLLTKPSTTFRS